MRVLSRNQKIVSVALKTYPILRARFEAGFYLYSSAKILP